MNEKIKAISERQRERGALALESYAADLRNADSDGMRRIGNDVAELAAIIMREYADMAARAEYYECPICGSDFHTERERYGQTCREMAASE